MNDNLVPPYKSLDGPTRQLASDEFEKAGGRSSFRLAMISGSLAAGLGHETSDLDIHVVLRPPATMKSHLVGEGTRVQFREIPESLIAATRDRTTEFRVSRTDRRQAQFASDDLWHFVRTCTSNLLYADPDLAETYGAINQHVAGQVLAATYALEVAKLCDDVAGLLRLGDPYSALYTARNALRAALEVPLALSGDLYALPKFLFARLNRNQVTRPITDESWRLMHNGPLWGKPVEARLLAAQVVVAAQQISAEAQLYGWDTQVPLDRPLVIDERGFRRETEFAIVRFSDAYAITGPSTSYRVSEDVARLWAMCNGRTLSSICADPRAGSEALNAGGLETGLAALVARGLVVNAMADAERG